MARGLGIGIVGAAIALVAALSFPGVANAVGVDTSRPGVVALTRQSTDTTAQVNVFVYYDYKGGATWNTTYGATTTSSYRSAAPGMIFPIGATHLDVPIVAGYRCQYVDAGALGKFAVLNDAVIGSIPTTVTAAIPGGVSLASTAAVSIEDTLPVIFAGVAGASDQDMGLLAILIGAAIAAVLFGGFLTIWGDHK